MRKKTAKKTAKKKTTKTTAKISTKNILYANVSAANKKWVDTQAKKANLRNAQFVDQLLTSARRGTINVGITRGTR